MPDWKDKFRGALVGAAVGDALGAPFEGARDIPLAALKRLHREPGSMRYTDDTHMMLGMAWSLVECRGFDGKHMAQTFAGNYFAEPWRGYGAGPPRIFRLIEQGVPWDQAARSLFGGSGSFGNGAAMRVAPAGLLACRDMEQVVDIARQSALITHGHELGIEGAVLQACAVALLLPQPAGIGPDPEQFITGLEQYVQTPVYRHKLGRILDLLPEATRQEVAAILGNGIQAREAVPAALYAFLRHAGSFADTVIYAISLGGDTDTIACMAGALAGAYLGEEAIPAVWRDRMEGGDQLRELADALLAINGADS